MSNGYDGDYEVVYIAKVYNRKKDPQNERKVVSFDRYLGKREDGTPMYDRCTGLVFESGQVVDMPSHLTLKPHEGRGSQIYNIYGSKHGVTKRQKPEVFSDPDNVGDFDDFGF